MASESNLLNGLTTTSGDFLYGSVDVTINLQSSSFVDGYDEKEVTERLERGCADRSSSWPRGSKLNPSHAHLQHWTFSKRINNKPKKWSKKPRFHTVSSHINHLPSPWLSCRVEDCLSPSSTVDGTPRRESASKVSAVDPLFP